MPITLPPGLVPFMDPTVSLGAKWAQQPPEGNRYVPFEIDWNLYTAGAVSINLASNPANPNQLSQIVALSVDNVRCGSDVQFIFPDSNEIVTVPAYSKMIFPVFTGLLNFYVVGLSIVSTDTTVFKVLNTMPPPIAIQSTQETSVASQNTVELNTAYSATIIAAGKSGTLLSLNMIVNISDATLGHACNLFVEDGNNNIVYAATLQGNGAPATFSDNRPLYNVRFLNGLNAIVESTTFTSGLVSVVAQYRAY